MNIIPDTTTVAGLTPRRMGQMSRNITRAQTVHIQDPDTNMFVAEVDHLCKRLLLKHRTLGVKLTQV